MAASFYCASLPSVVKYALARGIPILTPNERSAHDLRAQHNAMQAASGAEAWTPAPILSWNAWLTAQWSRIITEGLDARLLLNPAQEHILWREAIESGPEFESSGASGELDSLATLAASAWSMAGTYNASDDIRRFATTHDTRTFAAWAAGFRKHCDQRGYLPSAELPFALRKHLEADTLTAPPKLLFLGFDTPAPACAALLAALSAKGSTLTFTATGCLHDDDATRAIVVAADLRQETLAAAHWVRNFVATRARAALSHRVAVLVPDLVAEQQALEAIFREVLAPELQDIAADLSAAPYTFTVSAPLASTPSIAIALDLLRWATMPLPLEAVSALILSSFLGYSADLPARAEFDAFTLRASKRLRPEFSLADVVRLSVQHNPRATVSAEVANFLQTLNTAAHRLREAEARSYADWTERFRTFLHEAGWPGDRRLTAAGFARTRAWDHVLDSVATLDFQGNRIPLAKALEAVIRQAGSAAAPTTAPDATVQIMTPDEAAGSSFDAVVFLRATDANWPTAERPHPLLSWSLQRDRDMPGADPASTTARAQTTMQSIAASAPSLLCFFSKENSDGPLRPSPLITGLGLPQLEAHTLLSSGHDLPPVNLDAAEDAVHLPPLPHPESAGGSRVLKLQAACGFLAFSELRLRSTPIDAAITGFDAIEGGNFLHRAMQLFWKEVGSQEALRQLLPDQRDAILARSIAASVDRRITTETPWDTAYLELQKDRLFTVLRFWLQAELDRGPFSVVDLEQDTEISVGPLTLSVRMDRIDKVDGGYVFVDYKTGYAAHPSQWDGERPEDPQLPLYALAAEPGELKGLAFAKVRAGKDMAWLGYQADAGLLPMKKPTTVDIDLAIEQWRHELTHLAEDFAAGRATVRPRDFAVDCARCAQRLLCRVNPETLLAFSEEEDGDNRD